MQGTKLPVARHFLEDVTMNRKELSYAIAVLLAVFVLIPY